MTPRGTTLNGPFVRWRRTELGLTITACATLVGVDRVAWSQWEAGTRGAAADLLPKIAEALQLDGLSADLIRADLLTEVEAEADRSRVRRNAAHKSKAAA